MTQELHTDIVILGGGIAGLWLLNRVRQQGFDAVLLERNALGGGQTIASQGIIHGGLKYALSGVLSPASSAIAAMPERWRQCLRGEADVDLRDCQLLAPHYFMWSSGGVRSRLKSFLGSKALRGRIDALSPARYPEFLRDQSLSGTLYQLTDFVVDTPSLLQTLAAPHAGRLFRTGDTPAQLQANEDGSVAHLSLQTDAGPVTLKASRYLLCAGEGNGPLLQQMQIEQPAMQTRPLHMLAMHTAHPHPVFLHCIGDSFGMTPLLTITSHPKPDGTWVWYLGGEIAESGMQRSEAEQIAEGKRELKRLFPWVNVEDAQWCGFHINRAEPRLPNLQRPDTAYLHCQQNLMLSWPTKLTLTPELGDAVMSALQKQGVTPGNPNEGLNTAQALGKLFPAPEVSAPRWEGLLP
ncbi:MAG: FAD-dependent oxidoreductase [Pseudomonadales bacterium]|nr:FAD-dependent oxidoreductase [Pseudomonadales bacterium]